MKRPARVAQLFSYKTAITFWRFQFFKSSILRPKTCGRTVRGYEVIHCLFWWKLGIASVCLLAGCSHKNALPRSTDRKSVEGAPELVLQATRARLIAGWTPDGVNLWSVGKYGIIQHSVDGGKTWTVQNSGTLSELRSVWGIKHSRTVQRL